MKVKIQIEFEVTTVVDEEEYGELTENDARSAASQAAWDHLCLTETGQNPVDSVTVNVDGFGKCEVKVGKSHE